jgi:hypothetical protein
MAGKYCKLPDFILTLPRRKTAARSVGDRAGILPIFGFLSELRLFLGF